MTAAAVVDEYVEYAVLADPGAWPGGHHLATVGNALWIPWFALVSLILLLTPTGVAPSARWRTLGRVLVVACVAALLLAVRRGADQRPVPP